MSDDETTARIAELVDHYGLPAAAPAQLDAILRIIEQDDTAPTTVRGRAAAVETHVADSLTGLEIEALRTARQIADLGAGAGFPGLVLAVAVPDAHVALVESLGRKCSFLERAIAAAELPNAEVVCSRAEEWASGAGKDACDAVTARAVAPLAVLAEYAAPLLRPRGVLVAWKGVRDETEERAGDEAAAIVGLERAEIRRIEGRRGADHRHLYVYSKVRETPPRFPRRPGMASKRPLSR